MKVVAFNGSPRKNGNTAILIKHVFSELEKGGIETELVQLSDKVLHGCIACEKCAENMDQRCAVKNDAMSTSKRWSAQMGLSSVHPSISRMSRPR
jgi:multimeric flavodoxin WrbA